MTDYLRARVSVDYSENSDYSSPEWNTDEWAYFTATPDEGLVWVVEAATGGTTVTTSAFSTVTFLAVKNTDATNFVTATFRSAGNSAVDNIIQIPAKGLLVVTDFTAANNLTLTADTAACKCKVAIAGS